MISEEDREELKQLAHRNKAEIDDGELTRLTNNALRRKFAYPEWALFFEVPGKNGKRADAIAYNLFPSRNWKTIGFEVKASRSDWKKELETASKNDWFVGQVDEFYVVAGRKGIVKESELPEGWGLYEMKGGGKLYKVKESQLTSHQNREMDEEFYMRAVKKAVENKRKTEKSKSRVKRRAFREGKKEGKEEGDVSREQKKLMEKGEKYEKLDHELGVSLYYLDESKIDKINKALNLVDRIDSEAYASLHSSVKSLERTYGRVGDEINDVQEILQDLNEEIEVESEQGLEKFQNRENPTD